MDFLFLMKQSLRSQAVYKTNFIGYVFTLLVIYAIRFIFIDSLYQLTPTLGGWNRTDVLGILYFSLLITAWAGSFDVSIYHFFSLAHRGKIDPYLMKPVLLEYLIFFRWCRPGNLFVGFVIALCAPLFFQVVGQPISLPLLALGYLGAAVGTLVQLLIIAIFCLATLLSSRELPVSFIVGELNRLSQYPPTLFPKPLRVTLLIFLPLVFTASACAALVFQSDPTYLVYLAITLIGLSLLFHFLLRYLLTRFNNFGG